RYGARVDRQSPIDHGNKIEQLAMPHIDQPVDARMRKCTSNGRSGRNGVDEIAERPKPDDEDLVQEPLIREIRSRVEWSLGSPTMAIRPPYPSTVCRSGTVSTV